MNKLLTGFVIFILATMETEAQSLPEKELVGKWKVVHVDVLVEVRKDQEEKMELVKKAFLTSTLDFKADEHFSLDIDIPDLKITDGHWKIEPGTGTVQITEWKDKDAGSPLLMEMDCRKENGKTIFLMAQTFFSLEVVKE